MNRKAKNMKKPSDAPILLFDLKGVLIYRNTDTREIFLRPHIKEVLNKLLEYFHIGIFTSVSKSNTEGVIKMIEKECGGVVFVRNYIFTREHTESFTTWERKIYKVPDNKKKKRLRNIFSLKTMQRTYIIDDDVLRVQEKNRVIPILTWTGDMNDVELLWLRDILMKKIERSV